MQLTCNHFTNPEGILSQPVFGWKMTSVENGQLQTGYQILVSSNLKNSSVAIGDIWDSKKVRSVDQINIPFNGKKLNSSTRYYWKVRVWDRFGKMTEWSKPSNFVTAILNKEELKGEWITSNKEKGQAAPLFRKSFTLSAKPEQAIIHISGLGYYELYVNGRKVGDHVDLGYRSSCKYHC